MVRVEEREKATQKERKRGGEGRDKVTSFFLTGTFRSL